MLVDIVLVFNQQHIEDDSADHPLWVDSLFIRKAGNTHDLSRRPVFRAHICVALNSCTATARKEMVEFYETVGPATRDTGTGLVR